MPASISQRNAAVPACCKEDLSSGIGKVLGDLTTRLTASHDKNSASFECRGTAIVGSIDLGDIPRDLARQRRAFRSIEAAAGDYDVSSAQRSLRCPNKVIPRHIERYLDHSLVRIDRQAVPRGIALQHRDELVPSHRALGISSLVPVSGHHRQNSREIEVKVVPALRAPSFTYSATFKNYMRNARDAQPLA